MPCRDSAIRDSARAISITLNAAALSSSYASFHIDADNIDDHYRHTDHHHVAYELRFGHDADAISLLLLIRRLSYALMRQMLYCLT